MADRKSGPVKPPVIDLTAREARRNTDGGKAASERSSMPKSAARPKAAAGAQAGPKPAQSSQSAERPAGTEPPKAAQGPRPAPQTPPPPRPQARLAMPWSAISIAAVGGALLGTALTYLLASWIALPSSAPTFDDPAPALLEQAGRLEGLERRFAALEESALDTRLSLDATITQLDTGFADVRKSLDDLREAIPEPATVDLSGIEAQLRALDSRVDAIGAGASSADAGALAQSLVAIEANLADLATRLQQVEKRTAAADAAIRSFAADLDAARSAIAAQSLSVGTTGLAPAIKLPLVVSGLEAAFAAGRPFVAELESLGAILPDLEVPAAIAGSASSGLARPDDLTNRFAAAVPDILAGRTRTTSGDWAQDALDWAKALLALRPAGEIEGNSPEAIMSRLEAAVGRGDFSAASALLQQLPEPMRRAAGPLAGEIAVHAEAARFIATLRTLALAPAAAEGGP